MMRNRPEGLQLGDERTLRGVSPKEFTTRRKGFERQEMPRPETNVYAAPRGARSLKGEGYAPLEAGDVCGIVREAFWDLASRGSVRP